MHSLAAPPGNLHLRANLRRASLWVLLSGLCFCCANWLSSRNGTVVSRLLFGGAFAIVLTFSHLAMAFVLIPRSISYCCLLGAVPEFCEV